MTPTPKRPKPTRVSGKTLSSLRGRLALSIDDFADAIGVHASSVYRWEAEAWPQLRRGTVELIKALAKVKAANLLILGQRIAAACAKGHRLEASQLLLTAATVKENP